ncbi:unnamed protein product [Phytomonas sp. Hart1]|nr:unnamed protein product [Phytomonas sp. Hart1]|eukprot:CCW67398.1 unnamed protein product [Phytomonas sp. isolate Hart1]
MPLVDFDVRTVPDIIEAQLTLSYSRLSDIIRVIIDQGNGHEDDIDDMRKSIDTLTQKCARLQEEVDELRSKTSNKEEMLDSIEELRKITTGLSTNLEDLTKKQAEDVSERREVETKFQSTMDTTTTTLRELEAQVEHNATLLKTLEQSLAGVQSFADLWNGDLERITLLTRRDEKDPSQFEHSVDERTEYVLSLPIFEKLRDELDVLRLMINTQATNSIKLKADRSASDTRGVIAEVQDTLEGLNRRLSTLEDAKSELSTAGRTSLGNQNEVLPGKLFEQDTRGVSSSDATVNIIVEELANRVSQLETAASLSRTSPFERNIAAYQNSPVPQSNASSMGPGSSISVHSGNIPNKKDLQAMERRSLTASPGLGASNNDLMHRVEGLELAAGLLETNKAERQELYALEDAINQMFQREGHVISLRPSSAKLPAIFHNGSSRVGATPLTDTQGVTYEGTLQPLPRASNYGRPLFVSNSSINLRDGVQKTNATITPVQRQ